MVQHRWSSTDGIVYQRMGRRRQCAHRGTEEIAVRLTAELLDESPSAPPDGARVRDHCRGRQRELVPQPRSPNMLEGQSDFITEAFGGWRPHTTPDRIMHGT